MTPTERRERITAVFELAIKLRPEEQRGFVERECRGDADLIDELKSLLSEYRESGATAANRQRKSSGSDDRGLPRRIGRYEVTGEIGSGGFGHVYSALDPTVGRVVAIKVLNAPDDSDLVKRFRAEAMTVANLHHKNIVTVHEFGEENGAPYLVMEFLEGTNVQDLIRHRTPLSMHEKLWIMSEVAEGLQCAHAQGVTHRDVKPANIMRLADGSVKIMDFGIARLARQTTTRLTQTGLVIGTLMYMAPEQFNGIADALSDIFAYGVTFYELLTGRHPFSSNDPAVIMYRIMNAEPDAVRLLVPDCPESIERIVCRTITKSRETRYTSLADVVVDMKPVLLDLRRQQAGDLFSRAGQLLTADQLDAAQSAVRKALELDPWHGDARQLRSRIEQALQRRDLVERANALLDRAEQELGQREFEEAAECFSAIQQLALDDPSVNARVEKGRGLIEQARNAGRLLDSAREDLQKEDLTDAFRLVSEVLAADPGNATGQQLLQEIQTRMTTREVRRRIYEEGSRAESLLLIGETDQALALLTELENRDPANQQVVALRLRAEAQKAEEERTRRLSEGIAVVRGLLKNAQFDAAVANLNALLRDFPNNTELSALRRHASEQVTARKRAEESAKLKAEAVAWIGDREFDRAIRALEAGVAQLGDDGDLTRLLQSAVAGKAAQERERAIARVVEDSQRLRQQAKLDDAVRTVERAIQRWGNDPGLLDLLNQLSLDRQEKDRRHRVRDVLRRANVLMDQKKPEAVVILLQQAIERDGDEPELRKLLDEAESQIRSRSRSVRVSAIREEAQKCVRDKRWQEALRKLDEGLRTFPGEASLVSDRASVAAAISDENRERALASVLASIRSLQDENRFPEATQLLETTVGDFGDDPRLLETRRCLSDAFKDFQHKEQLRKALDECQALLHQRRFDDAVRYAEACQVRYPDSGEIADLLGKARSARDAARRNRAIETALARASDFIQRGEFDLALGALEDTLSTYADSHELRDAVARTKLLREESARQRETAELAGLIEAAIAQEDWSQALERVSVGLERLPGDARLLRLKHKIEEGRYRSEIEQVSSSVSAALGAGDYSLAAELIAAALIRWPQEKKLRKLQEEVDINRADHALAQARRLLDAGNYSEAEQAAKLALRHRPRYSGANSLLQEITARKTARAKEQKASEAGMPSVPSLSRNRVLAMWAAMTIVLVGGLVYWASSHAKPRPELEKKQTAVEPLRIVELTDLSASEGTAYSQTLRALGGSLPIVWGLAEGSLPSGLSLDVRTGLIAGVPSKTGVYSFVAKAGDADGHSAQRAVNIRIDPRKASASEKARVSETKTPAVGVSGAKREPQPSVENGPITSSGTPTTQNPPPCRAKPFLLEQYGDSRSGVLTWTGTPPTSGVLEIKSRTASTGYIRGDILPAGVPVRLSISPASVSLLSGPSPSNCWDSRLHLQNIGSTTSTITVKWVVYQP